MTFGITQGYEFIHGDVLGKTIIICFKGQGLPLLSYHDALLNKCKVQRYDFVVLSCRIREYSIEIYRRLSG